jgi:hypothetical protein
MGSSPQKGDCHSLMGSPIGIGVGLATKRLIAGLELFDGEEDATLKRKLTCWRSPLVFCIRERLS